MSKTTGFLNLYIYIFTGNHTITALIPRMLVRQVHARNRILWRLSTQECVKGPHHTNQDKKKCLDKKEEAVIVTLAKQITTI